ncbi:MAG: toll/interleukin-1 receptor domain-containing protein [Oscillochloridaceae bacterium umkhey_bin13]
MLPPKPDEQVRYDVFLSYHAPERTAVRWLDEQIAQAGLRPWFDQREILPGEPWMQRIEAGLAQSQTIAVIIGPSGMGPWQRQEASVALRLALPERGTKRVIPVLLPGADRYGLPYLLDSFTWVEFQDLEDAHALERLITGLRGRPGEAEEGRLLELDPRSTVALRRRA